MVLKQRFMNATIYVDNTAQEQKILVDKIVAETTTMQAAGMEDVMCHIWALCVYFSVVTWFIVPKIIPLKRLPPEE